MLVPTSKLIANSESASKSTLEKPEDEVSQPHTDRPLAGEECDLAPRTAIDFQSWECLSAVFQNVSLNFERTKNVESKNSGQYKMQKPKLKHMSKVSNVLKDRIWK